MSASLTHTLTRYREKDAAAVSALEEIEGCLLSTRHISIDDRNFMRRYAAYV